MMDLPFQGWLSKEKTNAGRTSRLFSPSTNKRYFTIDFPDGLFYYRHSDTATQISRPIRFADIVKVELLADDCGSGGYVEQKEDERIEKISFSSSRTRTSFSSILGRGRSQRSGFVIHFSGKVHYDRMILYCNSDTEALGWADAINTAISLGQRSRELEPGYIPAVPQWQISDDISSVGSGNSITSSQFDNVQLTY
jgi:hypothetical protein